MAMQTATIPDVTPNSLSAASNNVTYHRYQPHPALRPFVEYYYIFRTGSKLDCTTPLQTLVPLNHPLLLFNTGVELNISDLKGKSIPLPKTIVSGFGTGSTQFLLSPDIETVGVFFHPQGMGQLLNMPMNMMTNQAFDAREIFGDGVEYVYEQLKEDHTLHNKIRIIDSFLLTCLNDSQIYDELITQILSSMYNKKGLLSIQDISDEFEISRQHLYRMFIKSIGVSPKVFVRMLRFHHLINLFNRKQKNNWHDILYNSGFYDQAHMIREFTSIVGQSPTSVTDQNLFVSDFYTQI